MYYVYADGNLIMSPLNSSLTIHSPKVSLELGKSGSFQFDIPPTNQFYDSLTQLKTIITVEFDDTIIFKGRVFSITRNFNNIKKVYCEGILSYLIDSVQQAESYKGKARELFRKIIDKHNSMVDSDKQFTIGTVNIEDADVVIPGKKDKEGNYYGDKYEQTIIESIAEDWLTSYDYINNVLIDYLGGYLIASYVNGRNRLDFISGESFEEQIESATSRQLAVPEIDYGVNMLDLDEELNAEDLCTVLIPLGDDNLTIEKATNKGDYTDVKFEIVNGKIIGMAYKSAVDKYGKIIKTHVFNNVNEANTLVTDGYKYLKANKHIPVTFTVKAVDMHFVNENQQMINLGDIVMVDSTPHNLVKYLICTKIEYDLTDASKNQYTFGNPKQSMTERYKKNKDKSQKSSSKHSNKAAATAATAAGSDAVAEAVEQVNNNYATTKSWVENYGVGIEDALHFLGQYGEGFVTTTKWADHYSAGISDVIDWKGKNASGIITTKKWVDNNQAAISETIDWKSKYAQGIVETKKWVDDYQAAISETIDWKGNNAQGIIDTKKWVSDYQAAITETIDWKGKNSQGIIDTKKWVDDRKATINETLKWKSDNATSLITNSKWVSDYKAGVTETLKWKSDYATSLITNNKWVTDKKAQVDETLKWKSDNATTLITNSKWVTDNKAGVTETLKWKSDYATSLITNNKWVTDKKAQVDETLKWKSDNATSLITNSKWVTDNKAGVTETLKWKKDNAESVAEVIKTAGENSSMIRLFAKYGKNGASIELSADAQSSIIKLIGDEIDASNSKILAKILTADRVMAKAFGTDTKKVAIGSSGIALSGVDLKVWNGGKIIADAMYISPSGYSTDDYKVFNKSQLGTYLKGSESPIDKKLIVAALGGTADGAALINLGGKTQIQNVLKGDFGTVEEWMAHRLTETKAAKDVLETYIKSLITKKYIQDTLKATASSFDAYITECLKGRTVKCQALEVIDNKESVNIKIYLKNYVKDAIEGHKHPIDITGIKAEPPSGSGSDVPTPWGMHTHTINSLGRLVSTAALKAGGPNTKWYVKVDVKGNTGKGKL